MEKVIIEYEGEICPVNQKEQISMTGKVTKYRISCKDCKPMRYDTVKFKNFKEHLQWIARIKYKEIVFPKEIELSYSIIFYYPRWIDSDALLKSTKDMFNGIIYPDDRQISEDHTKRIIIKGCKPKIIIEVKPTETSQQTLF